MKKQLYLIALLLIGALLFSGQAWAQSTSRNRARAAMRAKSKEMSRFTVKSKFGKSKQYASVGAFLGATNYFGDLAPRGSRASTSVKLTRLYLGGFYTKRITPNIAVRGHLAWARLRGDDAEAPRNVIEGDARYNRNLSFRNDVIEAGVTGIIDILPIDRGYLRRSFINGYGMLGLTLFYNNPKGYVPKGYGLADEGKWIALQPLGTEGQGLTGYAKKYSRIQPAIIVGGGVKYRLADKLDLGLEIGWRFTFTDYLDDVSTNYLKDSNAIRGGKSDLWYAMANKSGLAQTSKDEIRTWSNGEYRSPLEDYPGVSNPVIRRMKGNGVFDDTRIDAITGEQIKFVNTQGPRGNKALDGYVVTTLTATYILEFRARTPKFR